MANEELNMAKVNIKKEIAKAAVIGGIMCFIMSFLINYFLTSMPDDQMANAVGNGISGLGSGIMTAIFGMGAFFMSARKSGALKPASKQEQE